MAGIDEVLERLVNDPEFKAALSKDPKQALAGYDLTPDDLVLLAQEVTGEEGGQSPVEQRVSKAGFLGLFAQVAETAAGGGSEVMSRMSATVDPGQAGLGGPDT